MTDPKPADNAELWIRRARSDPRLGQVAYDTPSVLLEDACFHAQQCAEKAIKGLLSYHHVAFPRTHAIEVLLDLLKNAGIDVPLGIDEAYILTQFAVETRYPGNEEPLTRAEANRALLLSSDVLRWVEKSL